MEYSDSVLEESFQQASEYVRTGKFSATQDQQLLFYAYFKQATAGDAQSENAPSFFDFAGKAKFAAWSNLSKLIERIVNFIFCSIANRIENMTKTDAMNNYIQLLNLVEPNWLTGGSGHKPQKREKWICSSTMKQDEDKYHPISFWF